MEVCALAGEDAWCTNRKNVVGNLSNLSAILASSHCVSLGRGALLAPSNRIWWKRLGVCGLPHYLASELLEGHVGPEAPWEPLGQEIELLPAAVGLCLLEHTVEM